MATDVRQAAILELIHDSDAIPDSIQIVREKYQGDHAVVAATFRRRPSGRLVRGFVGLRSFNDTGWRGAGGGWSSGQRDVPPCDLVILRRLGLRREASPEAGSTSPPPEGSESPTGGRIEGDAIHAEVAILRWEGDFVVHRATAELLDDHGEVIRTSPMRPPR